MNRLLSEMFEREMPKMNAMVMEGLACTYIPGCEAYMKQVGRSAWHGLIKDLEFVDFVRVQPGEEYNVATRVKNNRRTFDLAKSDLYLCKYILKYKGIELPPQYIYMPFTRPAGMFWLGGSLYHFTPVLSDKVISPGAKSIFVRLLQYKLNFYRMSHSIVVNNQREAIPVMWSPIYDVKKDNRKVPASTKAVTCLVHYLFSRFGFTKTFEKYVGAVPVVGDDKSILEENFPQDTWVIVESAHKHLKPAGYIDNFYKGSALRLAIPRKHWNGTMQAFVTGFFYVVDHFPQQFRTANDVEDMETWRLMLAYILFSNLYTIGTLRSRIAEHFVSLDSYVDALAIEKLAEKGYHISNFDDLLALITSRYTELMANNSEANSMYGKYLDIVYYAMLPITTSIFRTKYELMKKASKVEPSWANVRDIFIRKLNPGPIFNLSSDSPVTESVDYSGDHLYFKLTSCVTEQEGGPSGRRSAGKSKGSNEDRYLNASMIEGGSLLFLAKTNPTPANHINPFVKIDKKTGTIQPDPRFAPLLARVGEMLAQK